jgi:FlaG/FlaF family flagellin (archaellin)
MKKITYILLAVIALFVNSTVYAVEARIPTTSITQALQNAKSKKNFSTLKSAKFDVKEKIYNITYLTKDGDIENLKISKVTGKEVK